MEPTRPNENDMMFHQGPCRCDEHSSVRIDMTAMEPAPCNEDFRIFASALAGERGEDQRRIAIVGLTWIQTLLCKNADYGGSAWKPPIMRPGLDAGDAILVRMSDKIERLSQLSRTAAVGSGPKVVSESYRDTMADLGAYCLLYLAMPREERHGQKQ